MDAVVTTLRTVALFAELPREVLARLVSEFDELELPPGRTVFTQGDPGDALYVVVSGAVTAAVLITVVARFALPWQTAVPLLTVALTPFAQAAGLSPFIMALVALKAGNVFLTLIRK